MSEAPETTTTATAVAAEAEDSAKCEYDPLDDLDLPPLRIHSKNRFSSSSLQIPPGIQNQMTQKRYSLDSKTALASASPTGVGSLASSIASRRGRSRSRSPSLRSRGDRHIDGNSSLSSLEEIVDRDILYDKLGFVELENNNSKKQQMNGHNSFTLTPVSERMSEDTLEDVHAFSDLSANTNTRPSSSVGNSTTGGSTVGGEVSSHMLEPLYEGDDDDLESDEEENDDRKPSQVIVTNLENITLHDDEAA